MNFSLQTITLKVLLLSLLFAFPRHSEPKMARDFKDIYQITMTNLTIDLQEGFNNDTVLCKVNDDTVFHKNHVTTAKLTGLADSVSLDVKKGKVILQIAVKNRFMSKSIELDINEESYIGISLSNDSMLYIRSSQPFGYG